MWTPRCGRPSCTRRRRHVDVGLATCEMVGDAPRVACPTHGPTVAHVSFAATAFGPPGRSKTSSCTTPSARPGWMPPGATIGLDAFRLIGWATERRRVPGGVGPSAAHRWGEGRR